MAGITLAEAQTHLAEAQAALSKARKAQLYSIGDLQLSRPRLEALQADVTFWSRLVREKSLADQGVTNPGFITPKWT